VIAIAPSAFAAHHEVTITNAPGSSTPGCEDTNSCFIPNPVTVDLGTIVTWENTDTAAHTASSGTATDGPSGVFDSSLIMATQSFSYTTDTVGTFDYFCMVHPWMTGTLIVEDPAVAQAAADAADAEADAEADAAAAIAALEAEQAAKEAAAAAMVRPTIDAADYISASGASVTSITANADDDSVIIVIDAVDDGTLSVQLHDKIIKAFDDGSYFVLIDNEEVEFEQSGNSLTIPYEAGNERIEIVGSYAVPEFGTIAMIILAVAIVSIIAITAKTRMTLIPKL
jgi:predicted secreted protein with PEFG-CTERM motif